MTKLAIGVDKYLEGETSFALGRVVQIDGNEIVETRVPVGMNQKTIVDVSPGHYVVQVAMPTGPVLSRSITIAEHQEELRFQPEHSAHEWLSWSNFASGTGAQGSILARTNFGPGEDPASAVDERGIEVVIGGKQVPIKLGVASKYLDGIDVNIKTESDPPYVVVTMTTPRVDADARVWPRAFLTANSSSGRVSMSVPIPWPTRDAPIEQSCAVDVLLKDQSLFDTPGSQRREQRSVIVRHSMYGAIFAYLAAGNPAAAVSMGRDLELSAKQMLFDKRVNPYAAAAAGYVLLRSTDPHAPAEWVPWLTNLADWFPQLPDGAVLAGWHMLQQPVPDVSRATDLLLKAVGRGVPMYTEGVRLLIEGLSVLPERKTPDIVAALRRAREWGARLDPREAFTVMRGDEITTAHSQVSQRAAMR